MKFATVGPVSQNELRKALAAAKASFDGPARLGVAYYPITANLPALHAAWKASFDAPLVGASAAGIAFTERGPTDSGVVIGIFGGPEVGIGVAEGLKASPGPSLTRAIRAACAAQPRANAVLVLTDPFACDGDLVVSALRSVLPVHTRAFGAAAGDSDRFIGVKLLWDQRILNDAAIFVALSMPKPVALEVRHGFSRVPDAREMRVTGALEARLLTLDGEPAAHAYAEELRRLHLLEAGTSLIQSMARFSLGISTPFGEGLIIRTPIQVLARGEIQMTSSIPNGQTVSIVTTSKTEMLAAAQWLRAQIAANVPNTAGILVFDCGGRMARLGADFGDEVAALQGGSSVPMLGVTGYGEIAKFGGNVHGFHNITAVMTGF